MEQSIAYALTAGGMDVLATVERFGGNENLLLKFLRRFPDDPSFRALETAIQGDDRELAKVHCHTLKGISGNLGLTSLFTACANMMAGLCAGDETTVALTYAQVGVEYHRAVDLLRTLG